MNNDNTKKSNYNNNMNMDSHDKTTVIVIGIVVAGAILLGTLFAAYDMYTTKAYLEHGYELGHLPA